MVGDVAVCCNEVQVAVVAGELAVVGESVFDPVPAEGWTNGPGAAGHAGGHRPPKLPKSPTR